MECAMGEVIRFASKFERERTRLILKARAIYDRVFPLAPAANEHSGEASVVHPISGRG
jgi:hypothetical protein